MSAVPAAVEKYVAGIAPGDAAPVRQLDAIIRRVSPALTVAIKYQQLLYTFAGERQRWVVGIDAHPKASIGLRFLCGVLMDDPRGVLRGGSSVLMTWDLKRDQPIDEDAVAAYVADAVAEYPEYIANATAIQAAAKVAAVAAGRRKSPG
jgi:hypothetical protein